MSVVGAGLALQAESRSASRGLSLLNWLTPRMLKNDLRRSQQPIDLRTHRLHFRMFQNVRHALLRQSHRNPEAIGDRVQPMGHGFDEIGPVSPRVTHSTTGLS
jgi:hypothetical protein